MQIEDKTTNNYYYTTMPQSQASWFSCIYSSSKKYLSQRRNQYSAVKSRTTSAKIFSKTEAYTPKKVPGIHSQL